MYKIKIGAQLFTIRDFTQTERGFDESMGKLSAIGYKCAQLSAMGDMDPGRLRETLDKRGIAAVSTHTSPEKVLNQTDEVIKAHKTLGASYIGIGSMPGQYRGSAEGTRRFIRDFTPAAQKIADAGLLFMYHNHGFEFEVFDGRLMIEALMEGFPPELMGFTLDVYWAQYAGADPAYWLKRLKGRIETIHYKDMRIVNDEQRFAPIMEGNLNWEAIFPASAENGAKWAFIEQDHSYGEDPFSCLETSFNNLMAAGFEA